MRGGGRGYVRPASLISVWSSAPFLQNNSVGHFNGDPSVEGRLKAFDDGIEQMLWPEKRDKDPYIGDRIPGPSLILRTTATQRHQGAGRLSAGRPRRDRGLFGAAGCTTWRPGCSPNRRRRARPDPEGHAGQSARQYRADVGKPAAEDRNAHTKKLIEVVFKLKRALKSLPDNATDAQATEAFIKNAFPICCR